MFKNNFKTGRVIFVYIVFMAFGLVAMYGIALSAFIPPTSSPPTANPTNTISGTRISGDISGRASNVTGTVGISNGGTGVTTANAALNVFLPSQVGQSGKYLTTDGANTSWNVATGSGVGSVSCTSPLTCSGTNPATFSMSQATSIANGWLSATDWNTFNNKLSSGGTAANADLLDGLDSTAFLNTSNDYGRSGVSSTLYESTTPLSSKYVQKSGDTMTGSLTAVNFFDYNNTTYYIDPSFTGYSIYLAGSIGAVGPFYDLGNTSYYVDPAGTSNLSTLCLAGTCRSTWPAAGAEVDTLATVTARGQSTSYWLYSPQFVDYNNSFYQLDPNGISNLSSVQAWSGLNVGGNTYLGQMSTTPVYRLQLPNVANSSGQGIAHTWWIWSSGRWKENITPIENALSKVTQLTGVYFDWKKENGGKHDIGMIAEDVGKVVPEVVTYDENGVDANGMDYGKLSALLVEAIKEQQKQIEDLKSRVQVLENK